MPFLEWRKVGRTYGSTPAVRDFTLEVSEGEIIALLGPSGSGKSTLLRLTAGLEEPSSGTILLDGRDVTGTPPHSRRFGLMFQEYCLFPHLNVGQNVEFGLRMQNAGRAEQRERVREMLALVRLPGFAHRNVISISGGEQQRVALARSLAPNPRLLMLDEPLGALDASLRASLLDDLSGILRGVGVTTLYVTHDQAEAMTIATRVALMKDGGIVQVGTPSELIAHPADAFAAFFLGLGALVLGTWKRGSAGRTLVTDLGCFDVPAGDGNADPGGRADGAVLLVRPEALHGAAAGQLREVASRVVSRLERPAGIVARLVLLGVGGSEYPLELPVPGGRLDAAGDWRPGQRVSLWLDPARCEVLPVEVPPA